MSCLHPPNGPPELEEPQPSRDAGISMEEMGSSPKAPAPRDTRERESLTDESDEQSWKAQSSTFVTESGMSTEASFAHPLKADPWISVRDSGRETEARLEHP